MHLLEIALFFAFERAGRRRPARIAMIAITTSNSMSVKAHFALITLDRDGERCM